MRIVLATNNKNKVKEFRQIFANKKIEICSLEDLNIKIEPEEKGKSFEENSYIKARSIYDYMNNNKIIQKDDIIVSDDSGLCIDYFDGKPGIYSSRFLGENITYEERFNYILDNMKNVPYEKRDAYFICCICAIFKEEDGILIKYFVGQIKGKIALNVEGNDGFGYDPIFYVEEFQKTMASIEPDKKNEISHRKKAIEKLYEYISYGE